MEEGGILSAAVRQTAENILSAHFGTPVRIVGVQHFPYAHVARCTLEAAESSLQPTVILRVLRDDTSRSHPSRLRNERAALELLSSIGSTLAPRFIASDAPPGS